MNQQAVNQQLSAGVKRVWSQRGILFSVLLLSFPASAGKPEMGPSGEAFRDGMITGHWSSGNKQFIGTAYEAYDSAGAYSSASPTAPISRVWFTGGSGVLNEVFWPSIDTAQVVDSQFLVSDGKSLFFEERRDSKTKVTWVRRGVPAFQVTNTDPQGRFTIEKTIFSDPDRDVILQHVRITRNIPGLRFYYLHKPAVGNTIMDNSAQVSQGGKLPAGLYAFKEQQAQAVIFSIPMVKASAGFTGGSDGYQDLRRHLDMSYSFETATNGNVAVTAWLDLPDDQGSSEFDIALGFGGTNSDAALVARESLSANISSLQAKFTQQWESYQESVTDLSGVSLDGGDLFRASVALLKSSEDKTRAGAFVASPTVPWGNHQPAVEKNTEKTTEKTTEQSPRVRGTGGYHLVWPRDLYQMGTAFLAINDSRSATAALDFLKSIQYGSADGTWTYGNHVHRKDGSFPQNVWTNGELYWAGLQMDEVAMPVALAYRLWRGGKIRVENYWDMVRRASDFLADYGPWSPMERWEESFGASPSTIASEIAGLRAAAEMAGQMQDWDRMQRYRATANSWSMKPGDNIETWTFTTTGAFGNGRYYTRIQGASSYTEVWNPNSDQMYWLANGAGQYREKDVVDGGFLELVRFNVRSALDPAIVATLPVYDSVVGVNLPGIGTGYRRYNHDRYNYDDVTGAQTSGMLWPIFTGERGHYELQRAIESGASTRGIDNAVNPYIETMEKMATAQFLLPEQIWDGGPLAGRSTGSATPLGWSHAEYLRLLRSRNDRTVFDRAALPGN